MGKRILVVDDEPDLQALVCVNLRAAGFEVESCERGADALERLSADPPDLVVLDLMLPDVSGTEICRRIRSSPDLRDLPVVMLTARAEEVDRVVGFEVGADDYVTKPFSPRELSLRVAAVLRRQLPAAATPGALVKEGLRLDVERHRCRLEGDDIVLTAKEFSLLRCLMSRPGRVLTRDQLLEDVWGAGVTVTTRTVDTHLKRLREKLGAAGSWIETVRGVGYRFSD